MWSGGRRRSEVAFKKRRCSLKKNIGKSLQYAGPEKVLVSGEKKEGCLEKEEVLPEKG